MAQIFYPGVFCFENLDFGTLFDLKKVRQHSNFQNKTLQDRKFGSKMGDEIFYGLKLDTFEIKLPLKSEYSDASIFNFCLKKRLLVECYERAIKGSLISKSN